MNLTETQQYAVMIDGKIIFKASQAIAENYKANLPENQRTRAAIVPVTGDNKQILFG